MNMRVLSQIEETIYQLSLDEQLWLIQRLAQHIRSGMVMTNDFEVQLAAMADDPEIQRELDLIEQEFMITENDGLETV